MSNLQRIKEKLNHDLHNWNESSNRELMRIMLEIINSIEEMDAKINKKEND